MGATPRNSGFMRGLQLARAATPSAPLAALPFYETPREQQLAERLAVVAAQAASLAAVLAVVRASFKDDAGLRRAITGAYQAAVNDHPERLNPASVAKRIIGGISAALDNLIALGCSQDASAEIKEMCHAIWRANHAGIAAIPPGAAEVREVREAYRLLAEEYDAAVDAIRTVIRLIERDPEQARYWAEGARGAYPDD
jgi:hypothetical protein